MQAVDPLWLGFAAVFGASAIVLLRRRWFFTRILSLDEAFSACWVAYAIYMGVCLVYVGLKMPLGLGRDTHAWAAGIAACTSLAAFVWLERSRTDWKRALTVSLLGLLSLGVVVGASVLFFL